MRTSYLTAETYGVGELISQKKRFKVPRHQRDYSWTLEEVETYIGDIRSALDREASDYFIGLIVLHGPHEGVWEILDGQQRLATTTMLFSAIRQWLEGAGYSRDAQQIDHEFIALRQLGQEPTARLTLNVNDRLAFERLVLGRARNDQLQDFAAEAARHSSEKRLAEAAIACRKAVAQIAREGGSSQEEQVSSLYRLAEFLERAVTLVCLEVGSESDAYIIFESLNYRGHDLSVLDLVKNHIYGRTPRSREEEVGENWALMRETIAERDADDFLKVSWTSHFGRVQRGGLFEQIKERFHGTADALRLSTLLASDAEPYVAVEEPKHEIWADYPPGCSQYVGHLVDLRSKQIRPIVLSALRGEYSGNEMERLLWILLVLTVRYQTVGRRRTGALEIQCARVAEGLAAGDLSGPDDVVRSLNSIMPSDDEFRADFLRYSEGINKRALYVLASLEAHAWDGDSPGYDPDALRRITEGREGATVAYILPKTPTRPWEPVLAEDPDLEIEAVLRIGNRVLVERELHREVRGQGFEELSRQVLSKSQFQLTRSVPDLAAEWDRTSLLERQEALADLAVRTWTTTSLDHD